jgi:hypothetical protein
MGSTSLLSQPQLSGCFGRRGDPTGASYSCFCSARVQLRKSISVRSSLTVISKSAKKSRFLCFAIEDEGAGPALEERPRKFLIKLKFCQVEYMTVQKLKFGMVFDLSGPIGLAIL